MMISGTVSDSRRNEIAALAVRYRLPTIHNTKDFVEAGGLMSYGINAAALERRAATYVDKILKGAKPADLPVEQPTKFESVINLRAAKQIGLTIPPTSVGQSGQGDQVIRFWILDTSTRLSTGFGFWIERMKRRTSFCLVLSGLLCCVSGLSPKRSSRKEFHESVICQAPAPLYLGSSKHCRMGCEISGTLKEKTS